MERISVLVVSSPRVRNGSLFAPDSYSIVALNFNEINKEVNWKVWGPFDGCVLSSEYDPCKKWCTAYSDELVHVIALTVRHIYSDYQDTFVSAGWMILNDHRNPFDKIVVSISAQIAYCQVLDHHKFEGVIK